MGIEDAHTSSKRSNRSALLLWIEGSGVPFVAADSTGFVIFKVVLSVWGSGNSYTGLAGCVDCKDTEQQGKNMLRLSRLHHDDRDAWQCRFLHPCLHRFFVTHKIYAELHNFLRQKGLAVVS